MNDLYIRCEIWKEGEYEWEEVFYIKENEYNKIYVDENLEKIIKNPLIGKINLKRLWKEIYGLYNSEPKDGYLTNTIILDDGIHQVDIIIKEPNIFPKAYTEYYDENNYIQKELRIDFKKEIDNVLKKYELSI